MAIVDLQQGAPMGIRKDYNRGNPNREAAGERPARDIA